MDSPERQAGGNGAFAGGASPIEPYPELSAPIVSIISVGVGLFFMVVALAAWDTIAPWQLIVLGILVTLCLAGAVQSRGIEMHIFRKEQSEWEERFGKHPLAAMGRAGRISIAQPTTATVSNKGDDMGQIVRRVDQPPGLANHDDPHSTESHQGEGVTVGTELRLGAQPALHLSWSIDESYTNNGATLMVFHSTTGFCPENDPDDLNDHGRLIIETNEDGERVLYIEEGPHFFTFLFRKKGLLKRLFDARSVPLRFSEMVPSAKIGIGRITDQIQLQDLNHKVELSPMTHEAELNEAKARLIDSRRRLASSENPPQPTKPEKPIRGTVSETVAREVAFIDAYVEAIYTKKTKIEEVKKDPKFQKLPKKTQKEIMERIEEHLNPSEITSRDDK